MKEIIIQHYQATCSRGKINNKTTMIDFINKQAEEDLEANLAYQALGISPEWVQEEIDAIMVRINKLTHHNIDFIEELKKNLLHQQTRED